MKIWKLGVLNENSSNWAASQFKGDVIVRAVSENEARQTAHNKFACAITKRNPGDEISSSPWNSGDDVFCELYAGNEYDLTGSPAVLNSNDDA